VPEDADTTVAAPTLSAPASSDGELCGPLCMDYMAMDGCPFPGRCGFRPQLDCLDCLDGVAMPRCLRPGKCGYQAAPDEGLQVMQVRAQLAQPSGTKAPRKRVSHSHAFGGHSGA
jgi:hypothetical protein